MNRPPIRERTHRLPPEAYRGQVSVSYTACVVAREPLFQISANVEACRVFLAECAEKHGCSVVYTFMLDHIHLITGGLEVTSDSLAAMKCFKQKCGFFLASLGMPGALQKDFHDHILGEIEEYREAVRYLVMNPVRVGLVSEWHEFPHTGAIRCDLEEIVLWSM